MSITTTTHLNFHGTAREALEPYQSVFGGDVTVATYGDAGMPQDAPPGPTGSSSASWTTRTGSG